MPRISVPVSNDLAKRFSKTVPWSIRGELVRKLVEMVLSLPAPNNTIWNIVNGKKFTIVEVDDDNR